MVLVGEEHRQFAAGIRGIRLRTECFHAGCQRIGIKRGRLLEEKLDAVGCGKCGIAESSGSGGVVFVHVANTPVLRLPPPRVSLVYHRHALAQIPSEGMLMKYTYGR